MKKIYMKWIVVQILTVLFVNISYGYDINDNKSFFHNNKYNEMSIERLINAADNHQKNNIKDSALIYYAIIYNRRIAKTDTLSQRIICRALNKAAFIYFHHCDYKTSLELLLRALSLCEEIKYGEYTGRTYNSIGNVHYAFREWGSAKKYYKLAYQREYSDNLIATVLNNLGAVSYNENNFDSALILFKKAYDIKFRVNDSTIYDQLNNIGLIYQTENNSDMALGYYHMALSIAYEFNVKEKIARILSNIGALHLEINTVDSAIYYIEKSNVVAKRWQFWDILATNMLLSSEIAEKKGNIDSAISYYKEYSAIKDSVFNVSKYGTINQLQFLYDMSKVNRQIEKLNSEQEMKEQTIIMQRRSQIAMGLVLSIVIVFLIMLYYKNKTLNRAYDVLAKKNMEIVKSDKMNKKLKDEYEERLQEKDDLISKMRDEMGNPTDVLEKNIDVPIKCGTNSLKDEFREGLIISILNVMDNSDAFCDVDFSINKLAELVDSNQNYVSHIINDSFKKNFRAFINDYRIKRALKMLSDPDYQRYTIESIAVMVGFKSRNRFDAIFKEVTGITPSFYIRSLKKQSSEEDSIL